MLLIAEKKEDKMKLRQNKDEEIDLRTIADTELGNQINSMLPLDGTRKMTGVLETVGLDGVQIKSGNSNIIYQPANDGFLLACNCYKHSDGSFRYSSDGKACFYNFQKDSLYPPQIYSATEGAKDAVITYEVANILTDQTGVKKSGDTMTGSLDVNGRITAIDVVGGNYGWMDVSTNGSVRIIAAGKSEATGTVGIDLAKQNSDNTAIRFFRGNTPYNLFGEHNLPQATGTYTGNGESVQYINIGFRPSYVIVQRGSQTISPRGYRNDGFEASTIDGANYNGELYGYIAFKMWR